MSVLARELSAYQTAVDQYQRLSQGYNNSLLQDAAGNVLIYTNGQYYSVPAGGGQATPVSSFTPVKGPTITDFSKYGVTPSSGDPNVMLVRQNPTGTTTNTIAVVPSMNESGGVTYNRTDTGAMYTPPVGVSVQYQTDPQTGLVTAVETVNQYTNEPGAFNLKAPDPSMAQLRKLGDLSLAQQERYAGLDNGIIRSGGLKGGLRPPPEPIDPGEVTPPPPPPTEPNYNPGIEYGYL